MNTLHWNQTELQNVPQIVADRLAQLLETQKVTWFVSGGSNIRLEVETLTHLTEATIDLSDLTILLIDERFGSVGHVDSNWQQLREAGFMIDGPLFIAPFTDQEKSLEDAVARYQKIIQSSQTDGSYTVAQLGMGDDGHISGILPGSTASNEEHAMVFGYSHAAYERLTTTFPALRSMNEIILVAYGENKWPQLDKLQNQTLSQTEQPAQVLRDNPLVTIYTDYSTI